jgi:hypothetical protein
MYPVQVGSVEMGETVDQNGDRDYTGGPGNVANAFIAVDLDTGHSVLIFSGADIWRHEA